MAATSSKCCARLLPCCPRRGPCFCAGERRKNRAPRRGEERQGAGRPRGFAGAGASRRRRARRPPPDRMNKIPENPRCVRSVLPGFLLSSPQKKASFSFLSTRPLRARSPVGRLSLAAASKDPRSRLDPAFTARPRAHSSLAPTRTPSKTLASSADAPAKGSAACRSTAATSSSTLRAVRALGSDRAPAGTIHSVG